MSLTLNHVHKSTLQFIERVGFRNKWKRVGKYPEEAKTLEQRLEEMNYKDPKIHFKVDIGFPAPTFTRKDVLSERIKLRSDLRKSQEAELAARNRSLHIPLNDVHEEWKTTDGPSQIKQIAEYYKVFEDLFCYGYFTPNVPLKITYNFDKLGNIASPVYRGNIIKPSEATNNPEVVFNGVKEAFYTLQMSTPDGHFTDEKGEYLHWLVGNIPGNEFLKGQELCDYLQPFPSRGIGFCRYIFILYKHDEDKLLDFTEYQRKLPCKNLAARNFSTLDFYRKFQDFMTPCGISFFQSDWDQTLTSFYQNVLDMPEPAFEYDFPPITYPAQKWFPHKRPFNLYLDKYKDPKQLQKELLVEKLKERHPFRPPEKRPKYPLAFKIGPEVPSWLNDDIKRRRVLEGKWKFM